MQYFVSGLNNQPQGGAAGNTTHLRQCSDPNTLTDPSGLISPQSIADPPALTSPPQPRPKMKTNGHFTGIMPRTRTMDDTTIQEEDELMENLLPDGELPAIPSSRSVDNYLRMSTLSPGQYTRMQE